MLCYVSENSTTRCQKDILMRPNNIAIYVFWFIDVIIASCLLLQKREVHSASGRFVIYSYLVLSLSALATALQVCLSLWFVLRATLSGPAAGITPHWVYRGVIWVDTYTNRILWLALNFTTRCAMPWLRWSVTGLFPMSLRFNPRPAHVVDRVAYGQVNFFSCPLCVLFHQCYILIHSFVTNVIKSQQVTASWNYTQKLQIVM